MANAETTIQAPLPPDIGIKTRDEISGVVSPTTAPVPPNLGIENSGEISEIPNRLTFKNAGFYTEAASLHFSDICGSTDDQKRELLLAGDKTENEVYITFEIPNQPLPFMGRFIQFKSDSNKVMIQYSLRGKLEEGELYAEISLNEINHFAIGANKRSKQS